MDLPYRTLTYIDVATKSAAETAAAQDLLGSVNEVYVSLWKEFEAAQTMEARIVRAADKIQMMIKVLRYDREGRGDMSDFWCNVEHNENDWGLQLAAQLYREIRRRHEADTGRSGPECCG